jgi:site-specific recombinase XerD
MEAVRDCRAVIPVAVEETTAAEEVLAAFRDWLVSERGLAGDTVRSYTSQARKFVAQLPEPTEESLTRLDASVVITFVLE